ncbi:hypothetical protein M3Y94_00836600 [Aphelenchoides besseyi]|nr:hypothetical protein M3Y94_00836600 [Aphelenchoides besseyi]
MTSTAKLELPSNGAAGEKRKPNDDSTPFITPEIARRHPTRIPQSSATIPRKGILKRTPRAKSTDPFPEKADPTPTIRATVSYTLANDFFQLPAIPTSPRPTVGFSEKNAIAIIGDTSDEYESDRRGSLALAAGRSVSPMPQIPETTLVEPPAKMVDETPDVPHTAEGGCFVLAHELSESPTIASLDESKKTEGRSTDDAAGFSTEDDLVSLSSTCSSHIAGKWWNGKDTRFLLHCEKKNCGHKHGSPVGDGYLTPTQRSNREIASLKHKLKRSERECELKEAQLVELRERIKQIDGARDLAEDNRLMKLLEEKTRRFEEDKERWNTEREAVTERLTKEIFELQNQLSTKQSKIDRMERERLVSTVEATTMTDPIDPLNDDLLMPLASGQTTLTSGSTPIVHTPNDPNPNTSFLGVNQKSVSVQQSPSFASVPAQVLSGDALTEAYRQEAIFFRTKASELEIIVRQHILQQEQLVNDAVQTMGPAEAELPTRDPSAPPRSPNEELAEKRKRMQKHSMSLMVDSSSGLFTVQKSPSFVECQSSVCAEKIRELKEDNDGILEKNGRLVREGKRKARELMEAEKTAAANLREEFEELANLANERLAESISSQRAFQKLQDKNDTLDKALAYLEAKCQAYQNAILDHGLVVRGEDTSEWRRGFDDPRFQVCFSRDTQTELTSAEMSANESEFTLLSYQLRELQTEYKARQIDLDAQFTEIEQNLALKSQLVDQLTRQLEISARDTQLADEHRQKERDYYKEKIENLSRELERLPGLQIEVERLQQEKSLLEIKLRGVREEYEDGMEAALREALKKSSEQERYWLEKVQSVERSRENVKNLLDKLQMDFEELKMRSQVERTDLEQRLASSIEHVGLLDRKLNAPKHDVAVEAKPRTTNKYVACRPNQRHKQVGVNKSELEPSKSDENVAQLLKYKEALLRTKRQLAELDPSQPTPPRPPRLVKTIPTPTAQPATPEDSEPNQQISTQTRKSPSHSLFKSLRKNRNAKSNLSLDQVHYDSANGVTLPTIHNHHGRREENNSDALSFVSLPAVIDHDYHEQEEESTSVSEVSEFVKSAPIVENESSPVPLVETIVQLEQPQIALERQETLTSDEVSIEEIRKMEEHTRRLQDELLTLRDRVAEADEWEAKVRGISQLIPAIVHIGHPPTSTAVHSTAVDHLLEKVASFVREAQPVNLQRSSSVPDLNQEAKYMVRPCIQLNAKLRQKSLPRFRPLPIPSKWDNERNELLRQNARYAAQLLALKAKMDRGQTHAEEKRASSVDRLPTTEFDVLERELRDLAEAISTVPSEHAEQLVQARKQRDRVTAELIGIRQQLQDANNELLIYRREPRSDAQARWDDPRLLRSRSTEQLNGGPRELRKWKEATGTSFRELNRLRKLLNETEAERSELQTQLAIQRGELELARLAAIHERVGSKNLRRRPSTYKSMSLGEVDGSSLPDLQLKQPPMTLNESKRPKVVRAASHEEISSSDDRLDSSNPLHAELRRAFQRQISGLRAKNRELEGRIVDLENKVTDEVPEESEQTISRDEHDKIVSEMQAELDVLRRETEMYEKRLRDQEDLQIVLFRKGQQSAEFSMGEERQIDAMTEDRVTLKFLHDAFYHYLVSNRVEARDHLQAIMTILNFTNQQKDEIYRRRGKSH